MANLTWHPSKDSPVLTIAVEWTDENDKPHNSTVRLVLEAGKPTIISVSANGRRLLEDDGFSEKIVK